MLNQFKKSSIFKYKTLLLISLISIIQAQEISKNKYSLVLAPNTSNQWWSTYNQEGVKPSEFKFTYQVITKTKKSTFILTYLLLMMDYTLVNLFLRLAYLKINFLKQENIIEILVLILMTI